MKKRINLKNKLEDVHEKYYFKSDVIKMLGLSDSKLYRLEQESGFPYRLYFISAYKKTEVDKWIVKNGSSSSIFLPK